jgi:hypothetical protein
MKTYLAKWPNGTISVLQANSMIDLFWNLDAESNPLEAKLFELPKRFHLATCIVKNKIEVDEIHYEDRYNLKEVSFKDNILRAAYAVKAK